MATRWQWSSTLRFTLACTAAVIGLSGFWRLPHLLHAYGGGAFLLVYVIALVTLGLPLLSGQLLLARNTHADLPGVLARWTRVGPHARVWVWCGGLAILGATLLLACYSVIGGWSMAYSLRAAAGTLGHPDLADARQQFDQLARDAEKSFGWQLVFIGLAAATTAHGIRRGLEPVMRTLALLIAAGIIVLLLAAACQPHPGATLQALLAPEFDELGGRGILEALYQAFFTLSLGTGVIVALGSHLPARAPVVRIAGTVLLLDLFVTLALAFVFTVLLDAPGAFHDNGLAGVFMRLPVAVDSTWQLACIYMLLTLVALAAAIGLLEPLACLLQRRLQITRGRASAYAGVGVWLLGLVALLSFGPLASVRRYGVNIFDGLLLMTTNLILPIIGLLFCLLLGRVLSRARLEHAWLAHPEAARHWGFVLWHASLRYPTRIVLAIVVAYSLGGLSLAKWLWG